MKEVKIEILKERLSRYSNADIAIRVNESWNTRYNAGSIDKLFSEEKINMKLVDLIIKTFCLNREEIIQYKTFLKHGFGN